MADSTQSLILQLVGEASKMEAAVAAATKKIGELEKQVTTGAKKIEDVGTAADTKATKAFGTMEAGTNKLVGSLKALGGQLIALAGAGGLGMIVKKVLDFEVALREVETIANTSAAGMAKYRDAILGIVEGGGKDVVDVTRGLYQVISSGISDTAKATEVLNVASKLATAGLGTMNETVDVLTTVMNAWRGSTLTAAEASDYLFKTIQMGKTRLPELSGAMGEIASIAAVAGLSLKETMAAMVMLTQNGLKTSDAMTALKNVIMSYVSPAKETLDISKKLGIEISADRLASVGLSGAMADMAKATGGSLDVLGKLVPNIRAIKGAAILATDDGVNRMTAALKEFDNAAGVTAKAAAIMEASVENRLKQLGNQFVVIGAKIMGDEGFGGVANVVKRLIDMLKENQSTIVEFGKGMIQVASAILLPLTLVADAISYITKAFGEAAGSATTLKWIIASIVPGGVFALIAQEIYDKVKGPTDEAREAWKKLKDDFNKGLFEKDFAEGLRKLHTDLVAAGVDSAAAWEKAKEEGKLFTKTWHEANGELKKAPALVAEHVDAQGRLSAQLQHYIDRLKTKINLMRIATRETYNELMLKNTELSTFFTTSEERARLAGELEAYSKREKELSAELAAIEGTILDTVKKKKKERVDSATAVKDELESVNLLAAAIASLNALDKERVEATKTEASDFDYILESAESLISKEKELAELADPVKNAWTDAMLAPAKAFPGDIKAAMEAAKMIGETYFINPFAQALYEKVKAAGTAMAEWLKYAVGTVLEWLGGLAKNLFGQFTDLVKMAGATSPAEFGGKIQEMLGGITGKEGMLANLAANIGPLLDQLTRWIPQFVNEIAKQVPVIVEAFAANLEPLILALIDAVPKLIDTVVENLPILVDALIEALPSIIEKLVTDLDPRLIELLLVDVPKLAVQFVVSLISHLPEIIVGLVKGIVEGIAGLGRKLVEALDDWWYRIWHAGQSRPEAERVWTPEEQAAAEAQAAAAVAAHEAEMETYAHPGEGEFPVAHWGGLVTAAGVMSYAIGGFVSSLNATARRMREVPILAKPGEGVLTGRGVNSIGGAPGLAAANAGMGGGGVTVDLRGAFIGSRDVGAVIDDALGQRLKRRIGSVSQQIRGKRSFNVRGISKMP